MATESLGKRNLILFELPHLGNQQYIEMYINPQNIQIASRKHITETRTKGGFIMQYWGEDFDTINIQGTTGAAGVEGINVLRDVYRSEQLALMNLISQGVDKRRQSLAQLAASVVLWYQEAGYKGFFTDLSTTENTTKLGLFDYVLNMKVTGVIGSQRSNFMAWHRKPWSTSDTPTDKNNFYEVKEGKLNWPPARKVYCVSKEDREKYGPFKLDSIGYDPKLRR